MEIPAIEGGKHTRDWIENYFVTVQANESNPDKQFEERLYNEVIFPGIDLVLAFVDDNSLKTDKNSGQISLTTPPLAYHLSGDAIPNGSMFGPNLALGTIWLEAVFSDSLTHDTFNIPKTALTIWASSNYKYQPPVWLLKTTGDGIDINCLSDGVTSFDHGTLNQFKSVIDEINKTVFKGWAA